MHIHFTVIITGNKKIQLTLEEISDALYELVNKKADKESPKPHFDVEVTSYGSRDV